MPKKRKAKKKKPGVMGTRAGYAGGLRPRAKKKSGHGGKRKGAGRPATGRKTVSRCYTASLKDEDPALQEYALKHGISIDATVKVAVRAFFGLD